MSLQLHALSVANIPFQPSKLKSIACRCTVLCLFLCTCFIFIKFINSNYPKTFKKMCDHISKVLNDRTEFSTHLQSDIDKNEQILEETRKTIESLKLTCNHVKELSTYPEHKSLIPLGKNIYMNGRIIHTGEYFTRKKAYPDSYLCLQTLDQTIDSLEFRIGEQEKILEKSDYAKKQLEERLLILQGNVDTDSADLNEMPKEIRSEKGVALKVGDYYEILEFED